MKENILQHYGEEYNTRSAKTIVPYILSVIHPNSIVDVGCGIGTWLSVFKEFGVVDILGIDGPHIHSAKLLIDKQLTQIIDLSREYYSLINRRFDLAISLEVAEHICPEFAGPFIKNLTQLSDYIIFSAAIPGQTGENHLNEQPFSYWQNIFTIQGYKCYDVFRERFWNNNTVEWWYKQNMFLFVKNNAELKCLNEYTGNEYVHPDLLKMYVDAFQTRNVSNFNHFLYQNTENHKY